MLAGLSRRRGLLSARYGRTHARRARRGLQKTIPHAGASLGVAASRAEPGRGCKRWTAGGCSGYGVPQLTLGLTWQYAYRAAGLGGSWQQVVASEVVKSPEARPGRAVEGLAGGCHVKRSEASVWCVVRRMPQRLLRWWCRGSLVGPKQAAGGAAVVQERVGRGAKRQFSLWIPGKGAS